MFAKVEGPAIDLIVGTRALGHIVGETRAVVVEAVADFRGVRVDLWVVVVAVSVANSESVVVFVRFYVVFETIELFADFVGTFVDPAIDLLPARFHGIIAMTFSRVGVGGFVDELDHPIDFGMKVEFIDKIG